MPATDRYPIIYNPNANQLQELPAGDKLNLVGNSLGLGTVYDSNDSSGAFGQYLSVDAGGIVWTSVPPTASSDGISIFKDGNLVGAAFSFNQLNFIGDNVGVVSSSSPLQTANITITNFWTKNSSGISTLLGNVGIGSTLPKSKLDVIGDAKFTGVITATSFFGSGANLTGLIPNSIVNVDNNQIYFPLLSPISSGTISTISASSTSIVFNPGTDSIGIGTTNPTSTLTVAGNGLFTGVVTATTFIGQINAGVATITTLNSSGGSVTASTITATNSTLTNINSSGITTLTVVNAGQLSVSGISTFNGAIDANGDLDVDGITELDDVNIAGVATFGARIQPSSGSGTNAGIEWASNIGGGTGDRAFIKYFSEAGDNTRLLIGLENDSDDDLRLQATNSSFTGALTIEATTQSIDKDSGALIVEGGVGIEKTLNIGDGLRTVGLVTFSNTTDNTLGNPDTGAVQIDGGLGVNKNVSIDGGLDVDGITEIDDLNVSGLGTVATLGVTGVTTTRFLNVVGVATVGSAVTINSSGINVSGVTTSTTFKGDGSTLTGIVTQINAGIGITIATTQSSGKGVVDIYSYKPTGKTIFVSQNGSDTNTGLAENHPKKTIKAAAAAAFPGDTIKVFPGVYVENNPIVLQKTVSVEGTELRNCVITPKNLNRDLFHVNNGCHLTDLSFVGAAMTDGAAVVALQPLLGVSTDRFFDAARMIRFNLDYIASEAVGYLTSTSYKNPPFVVVNSSGIATDPVNCKDDLKDIFKSVIHDITRGGNSKCVGAGKSYYTASGALQHITGNDPNGYSVKTATVDAIYYAAGIARAVINNVTWGSNPVGVASAVSNAVYTNTTGVATITANGHGLSKNDAVKIVGLEFSCPSGPGIVTYPSGNLGYIFNVKNVINSNAFEVVVGQSTLPHTYVSGGTVQRYTNFQNNYTQVKDLAMQPDSSTGFNDAINGCANVVSAIYSCVGVVTSIIGTGLTALGGTSGIKTSYPANAGIGTTAIIGVTTANYDNTTGDTILTVPNFPVKVGDFVEVRDLKFSCASGVGIGTTTGIFPSGKYGYLFKVTSVNSNNNSFVVNTGVSSIPHTYVSGGFVVNRAIGVTTAAYSHTTGVTTITAPGASVKVGDFVTLRDLKFSCTSGAGTTDLYPTGNNGYEFKVTQVIGVGQTFVVNTGVSTIPHTYVSGGFVYPPYSPGVGPITQGPYIRNCTNFIGDSIGMRIDGFTAEPGDQDDIGVTGTMSVDSYTQYNQGGIGVSITNGAYAQLVSIFTICDDIAIYTASGGQCDITNSNSSFGNYGLYATGVGDYTTKSIYRSTGTATTDIAAKGSTIPISGVGTFRPYDGQVCYFGDLYYFVDTIEVTSGGSGYTIAPRVTVSAPTGPNGINAQATSTINSSGQVTAINIVNSGTQYLSPPTITIAPPTSGTTATASVSRMQPIYYRVNAATLPVSGISTVTLLQTLNNNVSAGTTVYFARGSLQLASTISFEHVGAGTNIFKAKPALGGVVIPENQVVQTNGGIVVYTSTDQGGNFKIGDGVVINQATGQISGRDFTKALFTTMTPFILALSD